MCSQNECCVKADSEKVRQRETDRAAGHIQLPTHHHPCYYHHHFIITRLDRWARIQFGRVHFGVFSTSRFVSLALSSDWTSVGAGTDLLWCKKRHVTHGGLQLTFFGAKNTTWPTGVPNWPFRCLDIDINMLLFQTNFLPPPHCNCHDYHCH